MNTLKRIYRKLVHYFVEGLDWSELTSLLENPAAKLSVLAPILGQILIYMNESGWLRSFVRESLAITKPGSYLLYWSLVLIALARLVFMLTCPKAIRTYKTFDDYIAVKKQTLSYRELVRAWELRFHDEVVNLNFEIDDDAISKIYSFDHIDEFHDKIHKIIFDESYPPRHLYENPMKTTKTLEIIRKVKTVDLMIELLALTQRADRSLMVMNATPVDSFVPLPTDGAKADEIFILASTRGRSLLHSILKRTDSNELLTSLGNNVHTSETLSSDEKKDLLRLYDLIERGQHSGQWQRDAIGHLWRTEQYEKKNYRILITRLLIVLPLAYFLSKSLVTIVNVGWLSLLLPFS